MATTSVTTAGLNLLSGGGFELNWVIRGTEWSNGSIPSGWQAISTHVASGSGSSGSAASDLVAIQRQVNSQADQAYALRMQFPGALPKGAELRVEWAGEEVARFDSASIGSFQSHTLMLPGIDGGALLKLITNRGVAFGSINGLGLWAQPDGARPLSLPASAKVGQSLVANTDSIADVDGLGDFNYQWQRKDDATQKWVNVDGGTQKTLKLNQDLVGSQLRVEVGYIDEDGFQEVLVSQATEDIQHANRAPSAGGIKQLASGQEDQSVLITAADLLAGSSDLDGDSLSLRRVRLTSGQGSLSRVDASTWRYTPRDNWFGEVNLSYQISDGKAIAKASASLLIEPVNDAPTASTVTLSAIEEDSVALISEADLLATANDIDGDVLSVNGLEVLEGDGTLSQNADGSWSFTPDANWNGAVRLGYSVSDGNGGSVQVAAKLTLDPVNDAPELTGEMAVLADGREDRAMTIQASDLLQGFTDPDGDPLQVINLRVSEGEGSLQAGESGSWVFTPGKDWSGTVTLDYQVSDGELIWRNAAVGGSPEQFDGTDFESAPWNFTGQGGVYLEEVDGWTPPEGELIEVKNNGDGSGQAANGEQFIELNQDPLGFFPNASGVFKDITTNAGQEYELSLQYAGRAGYDEDVNRFEVLIDGVSQGTWSQSNTTATPGDSSLGGKHNWETINLKFTASGPATRVELKEAGTDLPFGRGMRIDDIRIASIGIKIPADTAQQSFVVIPGNDVPELTGTQAVLVDGQEDMAYTIAAADLLQGYTDADGDSLSVDGLSSSIGSLSNNNDGTWTLSTPQDFNGQVELSYAVLDGEGGSSDGSKTFQLTPVNDAPVVSGPVDLASVDEDNSFSFTAAQLLANASDVDGDTLSVINLSVDSSQGSITDHGDGSFTFNPNKDFNGDVRFSFDVSDGQGSSDPWNGTISATAAGADLTVTPVNDAPTVTGDVNFGSVDEDNSFSFTAAQLLANASDVDGDTLSVINLSVDSSQGSITDHGDGSFTFNPTKDFNGDVRFSFDVSDGQGSSDPWNGTISATAAGANLTVNPVNDAPTVTGDVSLGSVDEDNSFSFTAAQLLANASDVDGDTLSVINLSVDSSQGSITDHGDGSFTFNPTKDFNGDVRFSFDVSDGQGSSDPWNGTISATAAGANLTVNPVNDAPTVTGDVSLGSVDEDNSFSFTAAQLLANASDVDGDTLSVINLSVDSSQGSITDHGDGSFTFNPNKDFNGDVRFSFDVSDGQGSSDPWNGTISATAAGANLTVNPVNDAPTVTGDVNFGSVDEDNSFSFTAAQLLANASDVDGDTLSVINLSVDPNQGSITDHGDGSFTFNPTKDFNGDVRFSFDVSDGQGSSDPWNGTISATAAGANLTVNPVNDAPTVTGDVNFGSVDEDNSFSFTAAQLLANASDVDGDTLSVINLSVDSSQGSITDHGDGSFTFNPNKDFNGQVAFSYEVSDGKTVVKNPVPTPPIGEPTPPVNPQPPAGDPQAIVTPASMQIDEAGTLQAQIQVDGMAAGSTVFWSLHGEHITSSDFANGQTEGSATLNADGSFSLNQALNADRFSEGIERFQIQVFADAERSSQLGQSSEIVILDSSSMEHRTINGAANNLANALLNSANSTFQRIGPADFADGVHAMHPDSEVTNARTVSNEVIAGDGTQANNQGVSAMLYAWGQFIDHDITQMANSDVRDPNNSINIQVPDGDAFLSGEIRVTRRGIASGTGVDGKPAEVLNAVTGWLDASMVYGSDPGTAARLRGQNGLMRVSEGDNLPIANFGRGPQFDAGDNRAAENPNLTALQTLFIREHNRLVGSLSQQHPEWSGDELYEHARAIVGAEIAQITYNEFLPKLIGSDAIANYQGHDASVDSRLSVEFSGAAYRFGHSLVSSELRRLDNEGNTIGSSLSLKDAFFMNPLLFVQDGGADAFIRNLASDLSKELDVHIADDLRNFLSVGPGMPSMDLAAINIQRGRDLGLGSLNETRKSLGLSSYNSFAEITSDADAAAALERAYGNVDDVELWVGGLAEDHINGGMVGETFQRIIADQFTALRDGDRLWFENEMFDSETLNQIKGTSLADLIRNNTDTSVIQDDVFAAINRAELIAQVGPEVLQQQGENQDSLSSESQQQTDSGLFDNSDSAQGTGEVVAAVAAAKAHLTVNPVNDAPTVSGDVSLGSVDEDNSFSFTTADLLKNASDVDGDPLSVVDLKVTSASGSLATNADGSFTFTPDANFNGEVSFSFGVTDGHGAADPWSGALSSTPAGASLTVNPVNDAPEVSGPADLGSVDEDNVFTFTAADLLQNAFDVDGDQLTVVDLKLTSNDGTLSTNPDGSFSFTPNANFNGQVSLSFGVSDGQGSSDPWTGTLSSTAAEAFFTVNPVNDAPEVSGPTDLGSMHEDGTIRITQEQLLANASDVEGDALGVRNLKLSSGNGQLSDNGDGTFTFTPGKNWNGQVELAYSVDDGHGASASVSANLTVNPVNDAPLLTGLMAKLGLGKEDHSFTIKASDLLAGFSDPDGDALSVANLRIADGQGTLSAGGAGTWTFTPDANWNGTVALEYQVTDGQLVWQSEGESQAGSTIEHADFEGNGWSLTSDGAAFVSSADGWQSPTQQIELKNNLDQQGTAASGEQFIELNEDPIDFFPDSPSIFKEIETVAGQSYNFSLQFAGRPGFDESVNRFEVLIDGVSQGTWSQNNSGSDHLWETLNLSFDASSSSTRIEIREAGDDQAFGRGMRIDDIRISTPGSGAASDTVRQTFEIAPVNDAPELTGTKAVLADGTEDVAYTVNAADLLQGYSDVDGDTLSVTGLTASVGNLTNNNDGTWTLTAPQDFNGKVDLSYSVADGNGASTAGSHSFSLTPVNDAPVVSGAVNLGEMLEDGTFRITSEQLLANASDVDGGTLSVVDLKLASGQGSITDNGDGSWTFSPDANWHGDVSFSYGVSDGQTTTLSNQRDDLVIRGNSLYLIVDGPTWTQAEENAVSIGGHLTSINDASENEWISNQFKSGLERYYIGLNDVETEGVYQWSSGEPVTYTNWFPFDEPTTDARAGIETDHVEIVPAEALNRFEGGWNDLPNNHLAIFGSWNSTTGIAEIPFIQRGASAYVVVEGKSWQEAEANAVKLGGNLVTINDAQENDWLVSNFSDQLAALDLNWGGMRSGAWIGLNDTGNDGTPTWSNSSSSVYRNYGQPDQHLGVANRGDGWLLLMQDPSGEAQQRGGLGTWWNNAADGSDLGSRSVYNFGIAEIKLGSDFGVSGSANLSVSSVNDVATGEPIIEVIGDPADEISSELEDLGFSHVSGDSAALDQSGSNPTGLIPDGEILAGSVWDDSLIGSDANDVLIGSITGASDEQWDVLTGGGGGDLFVLGNKNGSFYSSGGMADYAQITDFDPTQDQLQLHGGTNYAMAQVNHPDVIGTGVFNDINSDGLVGEGDDLIAVIANQDQPVEIQRDNLKFV